MIHPESNKIKNNKFKRKREIVNTNLFMRMSTGWLSERYSTTTVHKYCGGPNYLGISRLFHPLPLDSGMVSVENIIRLIGKRNGFNTRFVDKKAINVINQAKKSD